MSNAPHHFRRRGIAVALALTLIVPALAFAHAVVYPKTSTTGGREKYFLRVPNEKAVNTIRVEIHFPDSVRVSAFEDVAGWKLEILTDTAKRISGAVWTGTLEPRRFAEFPFMGSNPKTAMKLVWPTFQTYADGEKVEWTGEEGSKSPASVTSIADPTVAAAEKTAPRWVPWTALALGVISLGLALRPKS